jgi:hypothetical protein
MKQQKNGNGRSLQFIANGQTRVLRQKQLIAQLKTEGRPTEQAETVLGKFEVSLEQLRNHSALVQNLMSPDPFDAIRRQRKKSPHR